ncbi:MAG: NAD+ kinase [Gammaproteobacteria bacterium]|jgi:NAD+ kinase|nr:NAD+ kinase [Gammaproteobacteria bacterium]|tara:strand:- start:5263 stop:6129 length:867 start_codon:yes stop_codon:yes gene_type:complete
MFENIGIVLKNNPTTKDISVVNSIIDILSKNTKNLFSEEGSNLSSSHIVEHKDDVFKNSIDLLIVCGGDGTLLAAARKFVNEDFPILGINLGTLGFLAEINVDDFELAIKDIFNGDYAIEERSLVEAHFSNNEVFGLNEILIHSGSYAQLMRYRLLIDNKTVYEQRSDGLIIATPTGSSAYALSAGGSIIHPELDLWNIIPMMSQSLSSRPLIVSNNKSLEIQLIQGPLENAMVCVDGQKDIPIQYDDSITIRKKDSVLKIIHPINNDFYSACREKLGWSLDITAKKP